MSIDLLLERLLAARSTIAARIVERVRAEIPSLEVVPEKEHRATIEAAVELLVRAQGTDSFTAEARLLRELGERRARQGVPVEDLLRSWRIGIEETTAYAREVAPGTGARQEELFDLFQAAFGTADDAMVSITGGYRRDPGQVAPELVQREALVSGALSGRLSPEELHSGFAALELDPLVTYHVFRARGGDAGDLAELDRALGLDPQRAQRIGLVVALESELAGFCSQPPPRGALPLIAVGPAVLPAEMPASYLAAGRVLAAAESFGLVGVHDLTSAGLHAAVIEDVELGDALVELMVEPVRRLPSGAEILATVREWLAAGMRVEPAAERLFIHPNTVRYRLHKYEDLVGIELGGTEDAFRVWWALQRELAVPSPSELDVPATPHEEAGPTPGTND
jgi:hypothetical protein